MKTTKTLLQCNQRYKSGKPAYAGNIKSLYADTLHERVTVTPQCSNAGDVYLEADPQIRTALKKLRRGQIGARKTKVAIEGKVQIVKEVIAECQDLDQARETATGGRPVQEWLEDKLTYHDQNGNTLTLKEVCEIRKQWKSHNDAIRRKIDEIKKSYNYMKGEKMSDNLLADIAEQMGFYKSLTGFDLVITVSNEHVINTTDNYIICSDEKAHINLINSADYIQKGNRLIGRDTPIKFIVPIQSVDQIDIVKQIMSTKVTTAICGLTNSEFVYSEDYNPENIDFGKLKDYDSSLSG